MQFVKVLVFWNFQNKEMPRILSNIFWHSKVRLQDKSVYLCTSDK